MEFAEIRAEIGKYSRISLLNESLAALKHIQAKRLKGYPFWKLLVLIKWTYLHTDDDNRRLKITPNELDTLLKMVDRFETEYEGLNFKATKTVAQSFRIIAFQQFDYQEEFYNAIIDRQIVLYRTLYTKFNIEDAFEHLTKIKLIDFFNYCYFTYLYININKLGRGFVYDGTLAEDYNSYFYRQFSAQELKKFQHLLTAKNPGDFANLHRLKDERLQLFETNFYITKPFLRFRGIYYLAHKAIFNQTIKHFVYTYMKAALPDTFPEEFGKCLEKYVELGMKEVSMQYQKEAGLKRNYSLTKIADYLIEPNILIECKATELHPRSGVLRVPNVLTKDLNSSIIKAYGQLLSTANSIDPAKTWWGIIITYREMYLGFGRDAWEEFMKDSVEKYTKENSIDLAILPPENLFFLAIDDWDYMVQVVKDKTATIEQMLEKAKELNKGNDMLTKKFVMSMVLSEHFKIKNFSLSYLQKAHDTIDILSKAELFN